MGLKEGPYGRITYRWERKRKEADLIFTLIDLEELIENYGVKAVVEEMNQSLIDKLNEGLRAYYIKKANERLNGQI